MTPSGHSHRAQASPPGDPVGLAEAFRRVYFERFFRFRGRASRSEFWRGQLVGLYVVLFAVAFVGFSVDLVLLYVDLEGTWVVSLGACLNLLFLLLFSFGVFSSRTRRLRDAGMAPGLILLFLPFPLVLLYVFASFYRLHLLPLGPALFPVVSGTMALVPLWLLESEEPRPIDGTFRQHFLRFCGAVRQVYFNLSDLHGRTSPSEFGLAHAGVLFVAGVLFSLFEYFIGASELFEALSFLFYPGAGVSMEFLFSAEFYVSLALFSWFLLALFSSAVRLLHAYEGENGKGGVTSRLGLLFLIFTGIGVWLQRLFLSWRPLETSCPWEFSLIPPIFFLGIFLSIFAYSRKTDQSKDGGGPSA